MPKISNLTAVFNNLGTTYTAIKMAVTDTASASGSKLIDLLVGGSSRFSVGKDGSVTSYRGWKNAASRAALVSAGSPTDGGLHFDGVRAYRGSSGATAFSDLSDALPAFDVRFSHWGAAGDGSTDDRAKLGKAVSDVWDRPLFLDPEKNYRIVAVSGAPMTVADGAQVIGGYNAVLQFVASGSGTVFFLDSADDVVLDGVKIDGSSANGAIWQAMRIGHRNRIMHSDIDGGVTDAGGSPSHVAHVIQASQHDADDVLSFANTYRRLSRILLKTGDSEKTHRRWKFIADTAINCTAETLAFNNPGGTAQDILYLGMSSFDNIADSLGNSGHFLGGANVQLLRAIGNSHYGSGDEIFHAEENTRDFVAIGNTAYFTDARAGIFFTDNNIAGEGLLPVQYGAVIGNTLRRSERTGGTAGLDFAYDGSGVAATKYVVALGNVVPGWERALRMGERNDLNLVANNIFMDSDEGIQVASPSLNIRDNLLAGNTTSINLQLSGLIGRQAITREAVAWTGTTALIQGVSVDATKAGGLVGWDAEYPSLTIASAGTDYWIAPMGDYMEGYITIGVWKGNTSYRSVRSWLKWDGTDLMQEEISSVGAGITYVSLKNVGPGTLAVRYSAGAQQTGCMFQVKFDGVHIFEGA